MREREDLSACLNMDKLHYFFQPSVQSSPFFPIILRVNEVAWVMIEEEKNAPLLPPPKKKKKKKSGFWTWDEDRIHVRRESISWVECRGGGRNKKRGNPKVNEFDESISSTPDFHVNEVQRECEEEGGDGGVGASLSPAGP